MKLGGLSLVDHNPYVIDFLLNILSCVIVLYSQKVSYIHTILQEAEVHRGEMILHQGCTESGRIRTQVTLTWFRFLGLGDVAICALNVSGLLFIR